MDQPLTGAFTSLAEEDDVISDVVLPQELAEYLNLDDEEVRAGVALTPTGDKTLVVWDDSNLRRMIDRRMQLLAQMASDPIYQIATTLLRGTGTDLSRLRYAEDIRTFLEWVLEQGLDPCQATRDDLITYQAAVQTYAISTQKRLMTVLRLLYREMEVRGLLAGSNPTLMLPKIRGAANAQPIAYNEKQSTHLLNVLEEQVQSPDPLKHNLAIRDYAIMYLVLTSGIRAGELARLTVADIYREREIYWVVRVHGKGRKEGLVRIPARTVEMINRYKEAMTALGVNWAPTDPLFIRIGPKCEPNGAEAMTTRNLDKLTTKWLKLAELNGARRNMHQLRRTAATLAWENGATIDQVGDMLRHADLRTTRDLYIKPADRLRHAASEHIPL